MESYNHDCSCMDMTFTCEPGSHVAAASYLSYKTRVPIHIYLGGIVDRTTRRTHKYEYLRHVSLLHARTIIPRGHGVSLLMSCSLDEML